MVIIEPAPGCDTTIIVVHHPLQPLHISERQLPHFVGIVVRNLQFPLVDRNTLAQQFPD